MCTVYFQLMSAVKSGAVSHSRFAQITDEKIAVERSGGGV